VGDRRFGPAGAVLCAVCAAAGEIADVLRRLDTGEPITRIELWPLFTATTFVRHGVEGAYRSGKFDALVQAIAGRWRLYAGDLQRLRDVAHDEGTDPETLKVELLRPELVAALDAIGDPDRYRLRRQWHAGVPADAVYRDAIRWLLARTIREARTELRTRAAPPEAVALAEPEVAGLDPLEELVRREAAAEAAALRARLWAASSEAERRLLELLESEPGLAGSDTAARLGITPAYCRKLRERLRRRAASL
jgi:hypothetical protein